MAREVARIHFFKGTWLFSGWNVGIWNVRGLCECPHRGRTTLGEFHLPFAFPIGVRFVGAGRLQDLPHRSATLTGSESHGCVAGISESHGIDIGPIVDQVFHQPGAKAVAVHSARQQVDGSPATRKTMSVGVYDLVDLCASCHLDEGICCQCGTSRPNAVITCVMQRGHAISIQLRQVAASTYFQPPVSPIPSGFFRARLFQARLFLR